MTLGRKFGIKTIAVAMTYLMAITVVWSHCVDGSPSAHAAQAGTFAVAESEFLSDHSSTNAVAAHGHDETDKTCVQIAWNKVEAASAEDGPRIPLAAWTRGPLESLRTLAVRATSPLPLSMRQPPPVRRSLVALKTLLLN